jgi:hypothetical protein
MRSINSALHLSGRLDSNQRPPAPKAGALPSCATPRTIVIANFYQQRTNVYSYE